MTPDKDEVWPAPDWQLFSAYEAGKGRRYSLLFAVNGGAYALVGFLLGNAGALIAPSLLVWALIILPVLMIAYNAVMYCDIKAFGIVMHKIDNRSVGRVFGDKGRLHLALICALLILAWLSALVLAAYLLLTGGAPLSPAPAA